MEEKRVTIGDTSFDLPNPFIVFATQNPLEYEGTYPLPEAQLDRFLMRIVLTYPNAYDEKRIFEVITNNDSKVSHLWENAMNMTQDEIREITLSIAHMIHVDQKIYNYIYELLAALRARTGWEDAPLQYWPSTRAGLALIRAARVLAVMRWRDRVMPEDIKYLAHDILDHRMGRSYYAITEGIDTSYITDEALDSVHIP